MAVRNLVTQYVQPFIVALENNWYDTIESIAEATAEDLTSIGLPRRFAQDLIASASSQGNGGAKAARADKGKGKGKSKSKRKSRKVEHTVPVDLSDVSPDFKFRPKLMGQKGVNLTHIQDQSGASVSLHGSDEEGHLEFVIEADNEDNTQAATDLIHNLLEAIDEEYEAWRAENGNGSGKGKKGSRAGRDEGKGKGKRKGKSKKGGGGGELEEDIPINTDGIDIRSFGMRAKLVGENGRNVKHIEESSGARVSVSYDDGDGMAFHIVAKDEAALDSAREQCEDLLSAVMEEAHSSAADEAPERKGGKGKRKGGGYSAKKPRIAA